MNQYLEKIALTRLVKQMAIGAVKKTPQELHAAGVLRSAAHYAERTAVGTAKINAKSGVNISGVSKKNTNSKIFAGMGGGYATTVSSKGEITIHHNHGKLSPLTQGLTGDLRELAHQSGLRHEAYEGQAIRKSLDSKADLRTHLITPEVKSAFKDTAGIIAGSPRAEISMGRATERLAAPKHSALMVNDWSGPTPKSVHHNMSVLARESNMIRANPYLHASPLARIRRVTGENKYVSRITGKEFGKQRMGKKDFRALDRAPTEDTAGGIIHHM